MLHWN